MSQDSHSHDGIEYDSGCPVCMENIQMYHYEQEKQRFFDWLDEQEDKPSLLTEILARLTDKGDNNE